MWNIPNNVSIIPENISKTTFISNEIIQGINDFGFVGYRGSAPLNELVTYAFKLYVLNHKLDIPPESNGTEVVKALKKFLVDYAEITFKCLRRQRVKYKEGI